MVNTTAEDSSPSSLRLGEMDEADISSRDSSILHAIQEEGLTVFTFDGLKRMLGVHQEKLSRVLGRLEEEACLKESPGAIPSHTAAACSAHDPSTPSSQEYPSSSHYYQLTSTSAKS